MQNEITDNGSRAELAETKEEEEKEEGQEEQEEEEEADKQLIDWTKRENAATPTHRTVTKACWQSDNQAKRQTDRQAGREISRQRGRFSPHRDQL